jgi:hypothetical protein
MVWRWQCGGYGTREFSNMALQGAVDTEVRLSELHRNVRQGLVDVEDLERLVAWAIVPLYVAVQASAWGPRELFHRSTQCKLQRLGLLDEIREGTLPPVPVLAHENPYR